MWHGRLDLSLRPVGRAGTGARSVETLAARPLDAQLHLVAAASAGTSLSLRPNLRPSGVVTEAMARKRKRFKGAVCGDLDIQGEVVGRVPVKLIGCGVEHGVRVRSVAGVSLSQQSVMDCGTAKALKRWINKGVKPAVGSKGGGLSGLKVAAHYFCRTRNNKVGTKVSEHGKGRAIDISWLVWNDGRTIGFLKGWHNTWIAKPCAVHIKLPVDHLGLS